MLQYLFDKSTFHEWIIKELWLWHYDIMIFYLYYGYKDKSFYSLFYEWN